MDEHQSMGQRKLNNLTWLFLFITGSLSNAHYMPWGHKRAKLNIQSNSKRVQTWRFRWYTHGYTSLNPNKLFQKRDKHLILYLNVLKREKHGHIGINGERQLFKLFSYYFFYLIGLFNIEWVWPNPNQSKNCSLPFQNRSISQKYFS